MNRTKDKGTAGDGGRASRNDTVIQDRETQEPEPRMPHERDESADSQGPESPSARRIGEIAHHDLAEGQKDTDRGPVMDATYEKQKEGGSR